MSWLTGKVASLVREGPQLSADELAQTLEQRAKALSAPRSAAWLLGHWLEQCNGSEVFVLPRGGSEWHIGFQQVLLRSSAFELVLEACAKQKPLRESLTPGPGASSQLLEQSKQLRQSLHNMAERLLLPGALEVWPSLLDALLTEHRAPLPWDAWARRLLGALKRPWQREALTLQLNRWDQRAADLAGEASSGYSEGTATMMAGGATLSKQGIRAEMSRRRLPQLGAEAARRRLRAELLCAALEALRAAQDQNGAGSQEIQHLIADAGLAMESLDSGLDSSAAHSASLSSALSDCSGELQRQMAAVMLTQEAFVERRGRLQDERRRLHMRLEELDAEVTQLDTEAQRCNEQIQQLQAQFSQNTSHYGGLLGGSSSAQQRLSHRKSKAGAFQSCARAALELARAEEARRAPELCAHLRRRRAALAKQAASYLRQERLRLGAIADLASEKSPGAEPEVELAAQAQEAWRSAQALLQRAQHLLEAEEEETEEPEDAPGEEVPEAEALAFFSRVPEEDKICADCLSSAEWASVTYGIYLCVDCAGRHRGLGVHLSFVRSLGMDRWTAPQLRRMELGGSQRFRDFMAAYPALDSELGARYGSRAARFYRRALTARLSNPAGAAGGEGLPAAPAAEEGQRPAETAEVAAESEEGPSLASEQQLLETTFLELQGKLAALA
ncbi:unnamed protein product [Effrenium voratum]|uniref:Arf-GAP domain-containing protein n=1 Tax=Effrenium voratum TaxID=2562239 RepID=A0AA36JD64_9DINO|nr:unnamed protein product [Effrenium voratum]